MLFKKADDIFIAVQSFIKHKPAIFKSDFSR